MKSIILSIFLILHSVSSFANDWTPAITFAGFEELCVRGHANYEYWQNRLAPEGFQPDQIPVGNGVGADVMICSAKKNGMTGFTETYATIFGRGQHSDEAESPGLFQLVAYNTSTVSVQLARRLFASSHFLGHPEQEINDAIPYFKMIDSENTTILEAFFHSFRDTTPFENFTWEGRVFNSKEYDHAGGSGKTFFMRVFGETQISVFDADRDVLNIDGLTYVGAALQESSFTPLVWYRRENGTHQQSWASQRTE